MGDTIFKEVAFTPFKWQLAWLEFNIRISMEAEIAVSSLGSCRWAPRTIPELPSSGFGNEPGGSLMAAAASHNFHPFPGKSSAPVGGQKELHGFLPPVPMKTSPKLCLHCVSPWDGLGSIQILEHSWGLSWSFLAPLPLLPPRQVRSPDGRNTWGHIWGPYMDLLSLPSPWSTSRIAVLLLGWIFLSVLTPSPARWIDFIIRTMGFFCSCPPSLSVAHDSILIWHIPTMFLLLRGLGTAAKYQRNNSAKYQRNNSAEVEEKEKGQWVLCAFQHTNKPTGFSVPPPHFLVAQSFSISILRVGMKSPSSLLLFLLRD